MKKILVIIVILAAMIFGIWKLEPQNMISSDPISADIGQEAYAKVIESMLGSSYSVIGFELTVRGTILNAVVWKNLNSNQIERITKEDASIRKKLESLPFNYKVEDLKQKYKLVIIDGGNADGTRYIVYSHTVQ